MATRATRREAKIKRVSDELEALEAKGAPKPPLWLEHVNQNEQAFVRRAGVKRIGHLYRAGWPDFLIENGDDLYCVEVKAGTDNMSARQAASFGALERRGIRVYVWNPARPATLTPWRKYFVGMGGVLAEEPS